MKSLVIRSMAILLVLSCCFQNAFAQPKEEKPDFDVKEIPLRKTEPQAKIIPGSYIFILNQEAIPSFLDKYGKEATQIKEREEKAKLFDRHEREVREAIFKIAEGRLKLSSKQIAEIYSGSIVGFSVRDLDSRQAKEMQERVREMDEILGMGPDFEMTINVAAVREPSNAESKELMLAQSPSWGTNYTGWTDKTGSPYWAWILDTGIDLDHPDLNVKTNFGKSCVNYTNSANDDHGHGSHVAGIVAAKNNSIGTRGVAAGAWVVPIKVCTSGGSCPWSDILEGLQHVAKYYIAGDVLNMSLGKTPPSWWDRLWNLTPARTETQIRSLGSAGVHMVFAAGNDNKHANTKSPARMNGTRLYTISAMDWNYNIANFSNYGNPPVDYAAPGVSIRSCYKNGGYAYMDGTSMAAPYVAGILLANNGTVNSTRVLNTDKDSNKDRVAKR